VRTDQKVRATSSGSPGAWTKTGTDPLLSHLLHAVVPEEGSDALFFTALCIFLVPYLSNARRYVFSHKTCLKSKLYLWGSSGSASNEHKPGKYSGELPEAFALHSLEQGAEPVGSGAMMSETVAAPDKPLVN